MIVTIIKILFSVAFGVGYYKTTVQLLETMEHFNMTNSSDPNFPYTILNLHQYFH